jgi:hypothetical protein
LQLVRELPGMSGNDGGTAAERGRLIAERIHRLRF